jgi:hypothetical protein
MTLNIINEDFKLINYYSFKYKNHKLNLKMAINVIKTFTIAFIVANFDMNSLII